MKMNGYVLDCINYVLDTEFEDFECYLIENNLDGYILKKYIDDGVFDKDVCEEFKKLNHVYASAVLAMYSDLL